MQSLYYLRGRKLWVIQNFLVWGTADDARFYYLGVENVDSTDRIMFGVNATGGTVQDIKYSDLIDFRANPLPATIKSPRILIRYRSTYPAFLVGEESDTGFRIARAGDAPGPVSVDFFVYEMGG